MKIKDVCTYAPKSNIKARDATIDGQYMFFTSSEDESKRYSGYQFDGEGIIMGTGGNATLHYYNGRFAVSTDCVVLLPDDRLRCKYLYYFFLANLSLLEAGFKGAGLKHTNKGYIGNIDIQIPSLEEQDSIVNALDRVFEIKHSRSKELALLDNLIKARFVEMFGNPIDISLNRIPLSEYVDSIRYGTSQPPEFDDKGSYKFIRATNIKYGRIVEKDMLRISEKEAKRINKCRLHTGELIIVRSGANTGDTCVITNDYDGQYAGYDIIVSLKTDMLNPVFLNEMINIPEYMRTIVKPLTARSAQPHLNAQQVQSLPVVVADKERQNEFETFCKQVDKSKFAVQKALNEAQLLFDSLMQKYYG